MKLIIPVLKWLLPVMLLLAAGSSLISRSNEQENEYRRGFVIHEAALRAIEAQDYEAAYALLLRSAALFDDPQLKANALFEAAAVGWNAHLADFATLVSLYQQSLRYYPGYYEASWDLEYLYWLRENAPQQVPQPGQPQPGEDEGDEGDEQNEGAQPGQGEMHTHGDI